MSLKVLQLDNEKDVYQYQRWFAWPSQMPTVFVEIPIRRCVFPAPGRYLFSLWLDQVEVARRHLDLFDKRGSS